MDRSSPDAYDAPSGLFSEIGRSRKSPARKNSRKLLAESQGPRGPGRPSENRLVVEGRQKAASPSSDPESLDDLGRIRNGGRRRARTLRYAARERGRRTTVKRFNLPRTHPKANARAHEPR